MEIASGMVNIRRCYSQTSASELRIYTELKWIFEEGAKHRHKVFDKECDIFIPHYKLAIEYDGYPWHQDKKQRECQKDQSPDQINLSSGGE